MPYPQDRNWGCRISDEHYFRGLRLLTLENELLRVTVIIDRGTDVYEFLYKPLDIDFMWRSPQQLRPADRFVPTNARPEGFFMDYYHGGWQEIFPTGGAGGRLGGAEFGQHGEVSLVPWSHRIEKDGPGEVAAKMWTRTTRTPFLIEKTLRLVSGKAVLFIDERIVNEGREEMEFMWGHHPAVGEPFLNSACRIDVPASRVETHTVLPDASRLEPDAKYDSYPIVKDKRGADLDLSIVPPPESGAAEMVYLLGLEDGWYGVTDTARKAGFGMRWDKNVFPVVWLWEVFGGGAGYPWYGRTYNLALEPWTSRPGGIETASARGNTARLGPGKSIETSLLAVAYSGISRVKKINEDGSVTGN